MSTFCTCMAKQPCRAMRNLAGPRSAFAAILSDRSVVTWGKADFGDTTEIPMKTMQYLSEFKVFDSVS